MGYSRVPLDTGNDVASEVGITACKLVCKCGKYVFELLSVKVVSGTKETSTKDFLVGNCF